MIRKIAIMAIVISIAFPLIAQDTVFETDHYAVTSQNGLANARSVATQLEVFWEFFNQYFRFDHHPDTKLHVIIFASQGAYDSYLSERNHPPQEGYVYLHYGRPLRNVLLGQTNSENENSLSRSAFLQFLRSHITNPPLWLTEGFSVYLEAARYNAKTQKIDFTESPTRAESIQTIMEPDKTLPFSLGRFFAVDTATIQNSPQEFYAMAWGVVSFFLNSTSPRYTRILWDTIAVMDPQENAEVNAQKLIEYINVWDDMRLLQEELVTYITGLETFRSIMGVGIRLYREKSYEDADLQFAQAMQIKPDNYAPYYYRGLVNYEQGNHDIAETFYEGAVERGMDEHLGNYVFGLVFYARGSLREAIERLERIPPESEYFNRAGNLLSTWR